MDTAMNLATCESDCIGGPLARLLLDPQDSKQARHLRKLPRPRGTENLIIFLRKAP